MQGYCTHCGSQHPAEALTVFQDAVLCPDCLDDETVLCHDCDTRIWLDDDEGSDDTPLCSACYENNYTRCSRCNELLPCHAAYYEEGYEDEMPYCAACYDDVSDTFAIHSYDYKPEPIFFGTGPRYFGVELEIDDGGECTDHAKALLKIANQTNEYLYVKRDGSLSDGMELVTHPMSLAYQLRNMPWAEICRKAAAFGYLSHRSGHCGLHVHVSRLAFGKTAEKQDAAIARCLYFFEKHWEELLKFSRRTQDQLDRWAARYGYKDQPMEILDYAKKGYHGGRYTCINLQNHDTVEFRIFRGTLKPNTILATLQMLDHICDAAIFMSDEDLKALAWTTFVSDIQKDAYPELLQYLKERRLYVNEPVECEVEE